MRYTIKEPAMIIALSRRTDRRWVAHVLPISPSQPQMVGCEGDTQEQAIERLRQMLPDLPQKLTVRLAAFRK